MSKEHPPLTCADVKRLLANLGFQPRPKKGTSHEDWVAHFRGRFRKVTVDCHHAPFTQDLIRWMASQAGLTKKEFYASVVPEEAAKILEKAYV